MSIATYRIAIVTAILGLLLINPFGVLKWGIYSKVLMIHIALGIILGIMLIRLIYTHVKVELSNPFKRGVKKWNGFKLFLYLCLAILSGLFIMYFHISWVIIFHGFIGLWALLVGWKHKK